MVSHLAVVRLTEELQTEVAAILSADEAVGTSTSKERNTLRGHINRLQFSGRHGVLDGVGMLELTQFRTERLVVGETVRGPILMHHASIEVVHEHGKPTVCYRCRHHEEGAL